MSSESQLPCSRKASSVCPLSPGMARPCPAVLAGASAPDPRGRDQEVERVGHPVPARERRGWGWWVDPDRLPVPPPAAPRRRASDTSHSCGGGGWGGGGTAQAPRSPPLSGGLPGSLPFPLANPSSCLPCLCTPLQAGAPPRPSPPHVPIIRLRGGRLPRPPGKSVRGALSGQTQESASCGLLSPESGRLYPDAGLQGPLRDFGSLVPTREGPCSCCFDSSGSV